MVKVMTLNATVNNEEISLFIRYPCEDYEKDKETAILSCKQWFSDPRFSDFKIRLRDCDMDMNKILKVNENINEEVIVSDML